MRRPTRRQILSSIGALGVGASVEDSLYSATAAAPACAATMRITRYEVIPVRVPMHERIREPFGAAYRKQGIFRDYYDSMLVKLYTDFLFGRPKDSLASVMRS